MSEKSVTLEIRYRYEYKNMCFLGVLGPEEISLSQDPVSKVDFCPSLEHSREDKSMFIICHYNLKQIKMHPQKKKKNETKTCYLMVMLSVCGSFFFFLSSFLISTRECSFCN